MTDIFFDVLKASFQGSIVILAVMALRLVLKKAPKSLFCLLWLLAGLRLALPFEIHSSLSLQPDYNFESQNVIQIQDTGTGREEILNNHGDVLVGIQTTPQSPQEIPTLPGESWEMNQSECFGYGEEGGAVTAWTFADMAASIWLLGVVCMVAASAISYIRLKRRVRESYLIENGCFECPGLETAFVLGFLPPKIYLPTGLTDQEKAFIFDHENTHIARHDHWYKLLGYLVLSVHWFNPLVWIGYSLLCRDIELACDEHVVRYMSLTERKAYSAALLSCGSRTARLAACPVAFGESNPKQRILNVLNYKRPGFWISLLAVIAVAFVGVCLLTSPENQTESPEEDLTWNLEMTVSDVTPSGLTVEFIQQGPFVGYDRAELRFGSEYSLEKWTGTNWEPVEMLPQEHEVAWTTEAYLINRNATTMQRIDWEWLYGELPPGRYMLGKSVDLFRSTGDSEINMFWAEFEIAEESAAQISGEGSAYITLCREAMMTLKEAQELFLYVSSPEDSGSTANVYMRAANGWLFQYRRPYWDHESVSWLRIGNEQYIYGGDMDEDGQMTAPYYWQTETRPESHNFQLPYPFDLDWETIDLSYGGTVEENGMQIITVTFPDHLDEFQFSFYANGELAYFTVGDTSGEPEATTTQFLVQFPYDGTVAQRLEQIYGEAVAELNQKPEKPDGAYYAELFSRETDGAYTDQWIQELYMSFYLDPEGFVSHLANSDRAEEILTHMKYLVDFYAPYRFDQVVSRLEQSGNVETQLLAIMRSFTNRYAQDEQEPDALNDQIAWLAKCASALETYQAQGSWSVSTVNSFSGRDATNLSSSSVWYGIGSDYLVWTQIPDDAGTGNWWDLGMNGKTWHRYGYAPLEESEAWAEGSEPGDWDSGWETGSTNAQEITPPWPVWYQWSGGDIQFGQAGVHEDTEYVVFTVQGSPYADDTARIVQYEVTFLFASSGELRNVRICYSEEGADRQVEKNYILNDTAQSDIRERIDQAYREATE